MQRYLIYIPKDVVPDDIKKFSCIDRPIFRYRTRDIELDIHTRNDACIDEILKSISVKEVEEFDAEKLQESLATRDKEDIMRSVSALFSDEKYWEAHEVMESLWKHSKGDERKFYRGLILLSASMVHYQMLSFDKAIEMFNSAVKMLSSIEGINITIPHSFVYPVKFPVL